MYMIQGTMDEYHTHIRMTDCKLTGYTGDAVHDVYTLVRFILRVASIAIIVSDLILVGIDNFAVDGPELG